MFRSLLVAVSLTLAALAQDPPAPASTTPPFVEVPTFANPTCPIMGKKVSMPLFVDTEVGRFYVCCKPCFKKIQANVPAAHKTAYPVVQAVKNKVCPVSGEAIGADAVAVTLQGFTFQTCCGKCVEAARNNAQIMLTKITRDKVVDVGNETCPVNGQPIAANAFVLIGMNLVRLSSPQVQDAVSKDPDAVLGKALAIQKAQPPKAAHEHGTPPRPPNDNDLDQKKREGGK